MVDYIYKCNGPYKLHDNGQVVMREDGTGERAGCGAPLSELIGVIPEDGKDHDLKCPKCGNISSVMRTPPAGAEQASVVEEDVEVE